MFICDDERREGREIEGERDIKIARERRERMFGCSSKTHLAH
jgi:hypothetical protein